MSRFAKGFAKVGMIGAAVGFAFKFVAPNSLISSLADRSLSIFIGCGTAGSVLWIFHAWQNELLPTIEKNKSDKVD